MHRGISSQALGRGKSGYETSLAHARHYIIVTSKFTRCLFIKRAKVMGFFASEEKFIKAGS